MASTVTHCLTCNHYIGDAQQRYARLKREHGMTDDLASYATNSIFTKFNGLCCARTALHHFSNLVDSKAYIEDQYQLMRKAANLTTEMPNYYGQNPPSTVEQGEFHSPSDPLEGLYNTILDSMHPSQ
jgi:hypothetical protein